MSYAKKVKEELTHIKASKEEEMAELTAMMDLATELRIENKIKSLWFKTNNPTIARRFLTLLKNNYKIDSTFLTKRQGNFNRGYQIELGIKDDLESIFLEHSILTEIDNTYLLTLTDDAKRAYLRGAFLTSGSVNDPKRSEYHLEIYTENKNVILRIQSLMNYFDLNAKITNRRKGVICYLKEVGKIEDFLRIIGASDMVYLFEDIRIKRDFNNSINRVLNCEIANEKKAIKAANEQIEHIKIIENYKFRLSDKLYKALRLRKKNPDATLNELVSLYEDEYEEKISKSGLNHRFSKIKEIAINLEEGYD